MMRNRVTIWVMLISMLFIFSSLFAQVPNLWINEFHYDNSGSDVGEFVEIAATDTLTRLDRVTLSLYNGNGGVVYNSVTLDSFTVGTSVSGITFYFLDIPAIQNGPDGFSLDYNGTVVLFISYEGSFDATDGPAVGMTSTDIGVFEDSGTSAGESLQLTGTGTAYSDFTWTGPVAETKGDINTGQVIGTGQDNPPAVTNVSHTPEIPAAGEDVTVSAVVTDDNALAEVEVRYTVNNVDTPSVAMTQVSGDTFSAAIPGTAFGDGDILEFWVYAEDNAAQSTVAGNTMFFTGTTPIVSLHAADANGVLLYEGLLARINGVAIAEDSTFSVTNMDTYIQDATGGINLFQFSLPFVNFVLGNNYTVVGEVDQFNGKTELKPRDANDVVDNGPGVLPDPLVKTIAELLMAPETYEGMLVKIRAVENTGGGDPWPTSGSANVEITDDGGISLLTMRIDSDTDIDGQPEPVWPQDVIGIFNQFDFSIPYDGGYQILPRSYADFLPPTSVTPDEASNLPTRFQLHPNFPNPFNPSTTLRFDVPVTAGNKALVEISIFNILGQKVKTLFKGTKPAGRYSLKWDGTNDAGLAAPAGIYLATLKTNSYSQTIKLVLLK